MTRGTVKVKLRPIKLAFLVNPKDKESLLKAIEINTFLWGGTYNPIIPTYKQIPSKWKKFPYEKDLSAKSVVSGYLDNFDPDYVVPMGECVDYNLNIGHRKKIENVSEILETVEKDGVPNYGVGLFEILNYFFQKELKFQRRYPEDICVPRFHPNFHLFLSGVFGVLPKNIDRIFWEHFAGPLEAKEIECSASNYAELLDLKKLFLRRMGNLYLEHRSPWRKCIFFLDATKPLDIIDYWNLRAIGWNVMPVPKQFMRAEETKLPILNLISENYLPSHSNLEIHRRLTILKSRFISKIEHRHFLNSLEKSKIVSQTSYPRIWDENAREPDHAECCELEADTAEHDVSTEQKPIRFKTLDPKFIEQFGIISRKPSFANEIEWSLSDDKRLFAEAIPEEDSKQALSIVEAIGLRHEMRLFRKGVIYLACRTERNLYLRGPHAEGVFTRWLESKGWTVKLSPPGRIAQQMLQQLRGIRGTWILASEGIIQLLGKMNRSDGKFLSAESVRGKIFREIANEARVFRLKGEDILHHLVATKVFQLGMKIQCPICTKHSWYSVKGNDYELQCPQCLTQFSFPSDFKKVKWAYRTVGPFSSPNQADGAYTVLLTLRFFWKIIFSDSAMTPLMSFTAKKDEMEIEADLALFFQESKSRHSKTDLIFAECKTFNSFQRKDADRMKDLGKVFPEAVLVFAKLAKSLSNEEKKILCSLVNRSRKNRKNGRPFNPILILTGIELISEEHFYQNWEKTEGIHAKLAESCIEANLLELCDLTQQIYLDIDSWDQWLDKQYEIEERPGRIPRATWTPKG